MKNHGNIASLKENDSFPATKPKDKEYHALTDKEFRIAIMKKSSELQENSERQFTFSNVRNKTNEQKKYFAKEIETLKRNQKEILELKNSISKDKE